MYDACMYDACMYDACMYDACMLVCMYDVCISCRIFSGWGWVIVGDSVDKPHGDKTHK